jgi:hypothetical protein
MIQRIQTLFLLLAFGLSASLFFVPVWREGCLVEHAVRLCIPAVLTVAAAVLSLVTLFLYKRRTLQIRLCIANTLVLAGFQGLIAFYFFSMESAVFFVPAAFPAVAAALTLVAARYIRRDEKLVRAADRLR